MSIASLAVFAGAVIVGAILGTLIFDWIVAPILDRLFR